MYYIKTNYKKLIYLSLFFFIYWMLFSKYINHETWLMALLKGFLFAVIMGFSNYLILNKQPLYLKLHHHDKILEELNNMGAMKMKEKGEFTTYVLKNKRWPFNRIKLKKTPFYLYRSNS